MLKSPKTKALADELLERISSMLDEIDSKTVDNNIVISRGKRTKAPSEVKLVENVSKNLQSFLVISVLQKEDLPSHKLQDNAYE